MADEDGRRCVCSDEDYAKEMAYLKEKVDAGGEVRPTAHRHPMCLSSTANNLLRGRGQCDGRDELGWSEKSKGDEGGVRLLPYPCLCLSFRYGEAAVEKKRTSDHTSQYLTTGAGSGIAR